MQLYLYLTNKNKRDAKILTIFNCKSEQKPTPVRDVSILKLPPEHITVIKKILDENKMQYDLWVETAESHLELKSKLEKRGYQKVNKDQLYYKPVFIGKKSEEKPEPTIKPLKHKASMLRRNSHLR